MSRRSFPLFIAILVASLAPGMVLAQGMCSMPMPVPTLVVAPTFGSGILVRNLVPRTEIDRLVAKGRTSKASRRAWRAERSRRSRGEKQAAAVRD